MNPPGTFDPGRELHAWERHLLEVCDLYLVGGTVREILRGAGAGSVDEDYLAAGIEYRRSRIAPRTFREREPRRKIVRRDQIHAAVAAHGRRLAPSHGVLDRNRSSGFQRQVRSAAPRGEGSRAARFHRQFDGPASRDGDARRSARRKGGSREAASQGQPRETRSSRIRCGFCGAFSSWRGSISRSRNRRARI